MILQGLGGSRVLVTSHPSAILRMRDAAEREAAFAVLVEALAQASRELRGG